MRWFDQNRWKFEWEQFEGKNLKSIIVCFLVADWKRYIKTLQESTSQHYGWNQSVLIAILPSFPYHANLWINCTNENSFAFSIRRFVHFFFHLVITCGQYQPNVKWNESNRVTFVCRHRSLLVFSLQKWLSQWKRIPLIRMFIAVFCKRAPIMVCWAFHKRWPF